ncbi:anti-sigma factor [Phenylobacterium sp.]|uniref:anti-sigma factor family protein n=1 Tax=Phenylobacterium sp. TaxID=1871053 RepID=UPI0035651CFB
MTADERLIAYLDGELSAEDHAAFEAEMAADPVLAATVALHRSLEARIAETYAPVLAESVPPGLTALASAANDPGRRRSAWPQWAAMAACLALGVVGGRELWPERGLLAPEGPALVARGELDKALTLQLASDTGPVKVGLSFKASDGHYCRTFEAGAEHLAGLACRRDGRWEAQTTTAWSPQPAADYRTASSVVPPAVLAGVDALRQGETLDAAGERAARDRGWRP